MKLAPVALLALAMVLSTACSRKSGSISSSSPASSAATSALNDYTKPYLSEAKVTKFLESMKEDRNPFEVIFKQGGGLNNPLTLQSRMEEFNGFARRYGFEGYEDYMAVWGRIMVGQMQIAATGMNKGLAETMQKSVASAEENLKKPGLSPEMKQMYEEQVKSGKESLADLQKPEKPDEKGLNSADLELVAKYNDQLNEAAKKYQKRVAD